MFAAASSGVAVFFTPRAAGHGLIFLLHST